MKYSVFILLLITFSFSLYSDNQKLSITESPQDYSSEYRQKEYLEIIKLFESLFNKEYNDDIQKEVESLFKSFKGKSLTFSSLKREGSIHKLSNTYVFTSGYNDSYLERLKKNSKNKKELYLTEFYFPLVDGNTGYDEIPDDIDKYISERPHLKIVTIAEMEREALYSILNEGYKKYAISGKIDHLQYQDNPRRLLIFIK
ncbi:hypothetical protein [Leptospira kirschneri]|uniref:hypothetical protein n=1 Tax=Leptospira kirschneri TaxID=29507 RepID=UPI001F53CA64|nr:hypothetical protein [Leptospira kirschneri]UML78892.1 hypothetical protein FH602_02025 [Leptospira kirschneri]